MALISRDRVQKIYDDEIIPGLDIQTLVIPDGESWQITRLIFADKAINDGLSGGFQVDFGTGGTREHIAAAYLLGGTVALDIKRCFLGDGIKEFRFIRENNAAVNKKMYLLAEGFKRL